MKVLPVNNNLNFYSNVKETNNQTDNKRTKKEMVNYASIIGLIGLSTLLMLDRTSEIRIKKLLAKKEQDVRTHAGDTTKLVFSNLKNNKSVMSLDEISGLDNL